MAESEAPVCTEHGWISSQELSFCLIRAIALGGCRHSGNVEVEMCL